uniref:ORF53b n=1 Tax=Pinus koraiensis TaxID=88728 RepID=Q85X57_PINKO|nr:ORF53b [Pinus koraiensis]
MHLLFIYTSSASTRPISICVRTTTSFMSLSRPRMGLTKIPWTVPQSVLRTTIC